jgi:hypothetical protein
MTSIDVAKRDADTEANCELSAGRPTTGPGQWAGVAKQCGSATSTSGTREAERVTALVLVHTLRVQLRISSRLRVVRLSVRDDGVGGASPRRAACVGCTAVEEIERLQDLACPMRTHSDYESPPTATDPSPDRIQAIQGPAITL